MAPVVAAGVVAVLDVPAGVVSVGDCVALFCVKNQDSEFPAHRTRSRKEVWILDMLPAPADVLHVVSLLMKLQSELLRSIQEMEAAPSGTLQICSGTGGDPHWRQPDDGSRFPLKLHPYEGPHTTKEEALSDTPTQNTQ